ncbi:hypothetical protein [Isoptericola variabilis]|uniref:Uncharacterized protein n=1 Tax=Isoptericola variabilis (strain 225) TaxID=743718 RepID=F6FRG1_ISOV2|nr:hypothetical protein [Isoptericola variabilis]AEG43922.1 hypothetical protein Isova_1149 [Isoptericola variabilis 225]TWH30511.1 hypothetical protein L600_000300000640 [Isoptericola variabilis J7]
MTSHRLDFLPLGSAPRPTTGDDLAARLRRVLVEAAGPAVQGLDRAPIVAQLDGADVASLEVDLTGVAFGTSQHKPDARRFASPPAARREEATARRVRVDAHPLTAVDLPVDVTAEAEGLRFAWVEGTDGSVGIQPIEPDDAHPVAGHARVAVDRRGLVGTLHGILAVALSSQGVQLTDLDVQIDSHGPRSASVRVDAKVRKSFLSASVEAVASAAVRDDMVLEVGDVRLSSGNPLVAAMLGMARARVEAVANRRIDLQAALPPGVRLVDVRLDAGEQLVLSARLG